MASQRPASGRYPISGGEAELLRDADRVDGWMLIVDGVPQSHVDLADPTYLDFEYLRLMADLVDCLGGDDPLDVVHVGGGAGTLARYIAAIRPGSRQLVLEPDEGIVRLAREQLGLGRVPRLKVRIADGRSGVAGLPGDADDLLVLDAFSGAEIPGELVTADFAAEVARVLRVSGVYLANVADGPGLMFARRVVATIRHVFRHALLLAEPGVLRGRRFGNVIVAASATPLPYEALTRRAAGGLVRARCIYGDHLTRFCGGAKALYDGDEIPFPVPPPPVFG